MGILGNQIIPVYNPRVLKPRHLPDIDRLSVLSVTILLAYALARFVDFPERELEFTLLGIYLPVVINVHTFVAFLVAVITATGADWLLRDHPSIGTGIAIEHWLLPALTAWVIGFPLSQFPLSPLWWAGFVLGGTLLILVLVAEYISVNPDDVRQPAAAAGLIALSFSLYLMLGIAMRFTGARLIFILPAMTMAAFLVSLRTLQLRLHGRWTFIQSGIIAFICAQILTGLHYLPLSPVSFGILLLAPTYCLTSLVANLAEEQPIRRAIVEPAFLFVLFMIAALWLK
jgi:hypothetical protein